ncbi:MAG: GNAT family N-acetyltransferase [Pseudomonadota bacterium]
MSSLPMIEEIVAREGISPGAATSAKESKSDLKSVSRLSVGERRFLVYPPSSVFGIQEQIDGSADFAVEPNIFFQPKFCVPALNRIEEKQVRLLLLQDGGRDDALTRFLMPFTVERPGFSLGPSIMRAWSSPYGPSGVPIVERREASQTVEDVFFTLAQRSLDLPKIMVLPQVPVTSKTISLMRSVAISLGLPTASTKAEQRPVLDATMEPQLFLQESMSGHHRRNYSRLQRQLDQAGNLKYAIARNPDEVRLALEEFLLLENRGWKGEKRTSLASDRYRGAFAREAVNNLAQSDKVRIHSYTLDGAVIASLIVFVDANRAWTWKTTYDEDLSRFSPGVLLMMRATETMLDDPNILSADSCAIAEHPMMSRLWSERTDITNLVIGMSPELETEVRQVASQLDLYKSTRNFARSMRDRLAEMIKRR